MRTRVYVDGFNLYYGVLKGTPFKWLNPVDPARRVLPAGCVVDKLLYFTAHVSGASDPGAPARQHAYITALRTLPEVEVHFGSFLAKTVWRPLVNLPVAGRQIDAPRPVTLPAGDHTVAGPRGCRRCPWAATPHVARDGRDDARHPPCCRTQWSRSSTSWKRKART